MITRHSSHTWKLGRYGAGALLTAGMLVLAGCGAQVNSELEISDDLSGTRTIVAAIADDDVEELSGGIEAAEAALETHLPEQLSFEGISQTGSTEETEDADAEDGYQAVFTLEFSDLDDYQTKAQALVDLAAEQEAERRDSSEPDVSEQTITAEFVESDGPLLDGFVLEENFSGTDLLEWTSHALVDEEVVSEDQAGNVIGATGDEGRVTLNGEEHEANEPFSISEGADQRFSDVVVRITEQGAEVDFTAAFNASDHDTGIELGQQYLEDTGVGEIQHDDGYWTVTLEDSEPLEDQLGTLLNTDDLQIEVEDTANTEDANLLTTLTGSGFSCPTICRETPSIAVDWSGSLTPVEEDAQGDTFTLSYERNIPLDQVEIDTSVTLSGQVAQTYRFSVSNEHAEAFGDDLQTVFAPPEGTGSIDTDTQDDVVVYVTELDAAEPEELNSTLEEYLPGSAVLVSGLEGFSIWPSYTLDVSAYGVEALGATPSQTASLPAMHSADHDASSGIDAELNSDQTGYTLAASGPTLAGMLLVGGLVVLVIVVVVLVLVFRKRLATGLRSAQEHAQTMAHTANTSWQAAQLQQTVTDAPQGLPADDATWQAEFSEAKLH